MQQTRPTKEEAEVIKSFSLIPSKLKTKKARQEAIKKQKDAIYAREKKENIDSYDVEYRLQPFESLTVAQSKKETFQKQSFKAGKRFVDFMESHKLFGYEIVSITPVIKSKR